MQNEQTAEKALPANCHRHCPVWRCHDGESSDLLTPVGNAAVISGGFSRAGLERDPKGFAKYFSRTGV